MTSMLTTTASSDDDLDALFYEVQMMNRACHALEALESSRSSDTTLRNAFLESFLIHVRNLVYFFKKLDPKNPGQRKDDIVFDQFNDDSGKALDHMSVAISEDDLKLIHKHLSHLTKNRTSSKVHWPRSSLLNEVNRAINQFVTQVEKFRTKEGRTKDDFLREIAASSIRIFIAPSYSTSTTMTVTVISSE